MHPDFNDNIIQLSDRVKELSYTTGTNNMVLEGAAPGFSRFQDFYPQSGLVFYAITDGSNYEVGSGHYLATGTTPFYSSEQIRRYPFRSTNSNNKVDWAAGTKEVFVTYPAPFSVFTAFGVDERFKQPQRSGIAFWDNDGVASGTNILNYDSSGNWDKDNHFLGLHTFSPGYAIDIAGPAHYAIVKTSGLFLDTSGIIFSGGYDGEGQHSTRQVDPFLKNQVDANTGLNAVINVSGWVNESLVFKEQAAGQAFLGPLNDCVGGCDDGYPAFRVLHYTDIPDLSHLYLTGFDIAPQAMSGIPYFHKSGVLAYDRAFVWDSVDSDNTLGRLGINHSTPQAEFDLVGRARISSDVTIGGDLEVSGNLDVVGTTTYIDSTNVSVWDKQLELASMSGNATHDQLDSYVNDGGIVVRSSGDGISDTGDKKWTWQDSSNTWKAQTSNGNLIGVTASGMIFGNGTAISGAYQGGSGIDINGFNIDIGNVFSVSGNDNAAYGVSNQQVHQADNIVVSGVSGVSTWITKTGSKTTLHIDPGHLSGVLNDQISASGYAISGFFAEELHEVSGVGGIINSVSGYVLDSGYAISGALQYQLDNLGDVGEANQNAFSVMAVSGAFHSNGTSHFNVSANAKTDTITFVSGDNNAILVSGNGVDIITISGDPQFRFGADNQSQFGAFPSGYVGHNDGVTFSGGYGITTSGHAGSVTVSWSGGSNLFSLRGDSDAGAGGSTISSDGPSAVNISGDAYITTTRVGDTVKIAWSGGDNAFNWFKGDPATTLSTIDSAAMATDDQTLVFDDNAGVWKTATIAELSTKVNAADTGDASNSDLLQASGTLDQRISDSGVAISGYLQAYIHHETASGVAHSGFFSEELHEISGVDYVRGSGLIQVHFQSGIDFTNAATSSGVAHSGFLSEELHELSGIDYVRGSGLIHRVSGELQSQITTNATAIPASGYRISGVLQYQLTEISGINNDYDWFPSPNSLATIDDTHLDNGNDKILVWDNTAGSGWKSITIGELDDKIGAGADAGDPDQNIFNSVQVQTIAQMGAQHWDYGTHPLHKDNTNIDAGSTSDNLFFVGDTASGIAVNLIHSGVNKYIKVASTLGSDITANSGFFSAELYQISGVVDQNVFTSGGFIQVHFQSGIDYTNAATASGVAHSGFFDEELHEISGVIHPVYESGGIIQVHFQSGIDYTNAATASGVAHSGFFSEELHEISGVDYVRGSGLIQVHFQSGIDFTNAATTSGIAHSGFLFDAAVAYTDAEHASGVANSGFLFDAAVAYTDTEHGSGVARSGHLYDYTTNYVNTEHASGVARSGHLYEYTTNYVNAENASGVAHSGFFDQELFEISGRAIDGNPAYSGLVPILSGVLDQRISDSGVAVSGHCMTFDGSGIDIYTHASPTKTRTLNLNRDYYRKESYAGAPSTRTNMIFGTLAQARCGFNSYGSVVIGTEAGGGLANTSAISELNVMVGYRAGFYLGDGKSVYNVFIGNGAGQGDIASHSDVQEGNICIGSSAGAYRDGNSADNIFIGRYSGSSYPFAPNPKGTGSSNITIGSFDLLSGSTQSDKVNGGEHATHSFKFNLANVIAGDWNTTGTYAKRVLIGDLPTLSSTVGLEPKGTLELKAFDSVTTTFYISKAGTQSQPLMKVETDAYQYNSTAANTENPLINKQGFLRLPIFTNRSHLPAASDVEGMMCVIPAKNSGAAIVIVALNGKWWAQPEPDRADVPQNPTTNNLACCSETWIESNINKNRTNA